MMIKNYIVIFDIEEMITMIECEETRRKLTENYPDEEERICKL